MENGRKQKSKAKKRERGAEGGHGKEAKALKRPKVAPTASNKAGGEGLEEMDIDSFLTGGFLDATRKDKSQKHKKKEKHREPKQPTAAAASPQSKPKSETTPKSAKKKGNELPPAKAPVQPQPAVKPKKQKPSKQKGLGKADAPAKNANKAGTAGGEAKAPKSSKRGKSEAAQHKAQLEALKEKDPEFYKYLQDTDKELLDFQDEDASDSDASLQEGAGSDNELDSEEEELADSDESEISEDDEEEEEEADNDNIDDSDEGEETEAEARSKNGASTSGKQQEVLTQDVVEKWCREAKEELSVGALERIIKAYRVACHLGDEEDDMDATMRITSSAVFNKILVFVIREAGGLIRKLMKLPEGQLSTDAVKKSARWKKMEGTVKSFLGNSLHLLGQMTDEAMVAFMLRHLRPSIPFLIVSQSLQRKFLQRTLHIFGEGETKPRVQAILFIRLMAVLLPPPTLTLALKGVYRQFILNAKFMSPVNLPHINFMANCVVELYGLDMPASYELGFGYLRQIAIILRGALNMKSKEAFREVYCWQTISSMELWAKVLATHADKEELKPLVYPVVQLLMATVRLVPTARYFPLRLRCLHALNKLGEATQQYIPVSALLVEALQWQGVHKQGKSGVKLPNSNVPQLRAGKQLLESSAFQHNFIDEVFLLLAQHLALWSTHVAFPELAHMTSIQISKLTKKSRNERLRNAGKQLTAAIQSNSDYVIKQRNKLECSPKDTAVLNKFMSSKAEQEQAPMRKFAKVLDDKWRRQQALSRTDDVDISQKGEESGSDDEALPSENLLPELKQRSKQKGAKAAKQANAKPHKDVPPDGEDEVDEDAEDEIRDFEMSDSDADASE